MVSSTCGQLASYPLALVRTRMQANKNNKNNMLQEIADVARRGGVRALYSGMAANFLKVAPAVSIRSACVCQDICACAAHARRRSQPSLPFVPRSYDAILTSFFS